MAPPYSSSSNGRKKKRRRREGGSSFGLGGFGVHDPGQQGVRGQRLGVHGPGFFISHFHPDFLFQIGELANK
jgi:hypothetical protein